MIAILSMAVILNLGCSGQENKKEESPQRDKDSIAQMAEPPKGTWTYWGSLKSHLLRRCDLSCPDNGFIVHLLLAVLAVYVF
jgi:hypothetical protein